MHLEADFLPYCVLQDMLIPARRKGRSNKGSDRRNEMTLQERYQDVKDFWMKQSSARQRELLKVPIRMLLQGLSQAIFWQHVNSRCRQS